MNSCARYTAILAALTLFAAASLVQATSPPSISNLVINTISTDVASASGGDVLVRIDLPASANPGDVKVTVNGSDVTKSFLPDAPGHALVGLVGNLRNGRNVIKAISKQVRPALNAQLVVHNFPSY